MSSTQDTQQMQDRQVAVSDDDFAIMDVTDPEKDPESGAEESGTQADKCKRRWGRCHRRKLMTRQMDSEDECQLRSHYLERRIMRKMAKRWMMRMMWRRMMFRMSYGGPMGMGPGFGCRNRRRMRMMAAMMDTTDTSSSESGDGHERRAGWRRRRCCRGKKFGRHFEEGKHTEDGTSKKGKKHGADVPLANTEGNLENAGSASSSKDAGKTQTTVAEKSTNLVESSAGGGIRDGKCRRKEQKKEKCMRKVHFCDMTSGDSSSDSSSSSSESSHDENVDVQQETQKSKEHRCRRGWRHRKHMNLEGKEDDTGEAVTEGRKAWKGKKYHKMMMKRMSRMGIYGRLYY